MSEIYNSFEVFIAASWVSIHKISVQSLWCLTTSIRISKSTRFYANCTIEELGVEVGPSLKCMKSALN